MQTNVVVEVGSGYRVKQDAGTADGQTARYSVYRPDGSICREAVEWPEVERAITAEVGSRTTTAAP